MKKLLLLMTLIGASTPLFAQQYVMLKTQAFTAVGSSANVRMIGTGATSYRLSWNISGGTLSACSIKTEQSATGTSGWTDLIAANSCTSNGVSVYTAGTPNYVRITLTTRTVATGTPTITGTLVAWMVLPASVQVAPGPPSPPCSDGELYQDSVSGNLYYCDSNAWILIGTSGGALSGSGTNGQISYWTGATTLGGSNNFLFAPSTAQTSIGPASPSGNSLVQINNLNNNGTFTRGFSVYTRDLVVGGGNEQTVAFTSESANATSTMGQNIAGVISSVHSGAGTLTDQMALTLNCTNTGGGTVTNTYCLNINDPPSGGTLRYGLFNGTGLISTKSALEFRGSTSGTAKIGVAAAAGSPNQFNFPTTTGTAGQVLSTDGGNPQQGSWVSQGGLGSSGCLTLQIANQSPTGTTANKFVKVVNDPPVVQITGTSDFNLGVGIVTSGAGTTGSATVCFIGTVDCVFDNATTAGHYVTISNTSAGSCHDAGATQPVDQVYYGTVKETGSAGTRSMFLNTPDTMSGIKNNINSGKNSKQSAADQVEVSDSTTATTWRTLCGTNPLVFDTSTNTFSCPAIGSPFQASKTPAGGFIGMNFNGGGGSSQMPFNTSTWRATAQYFLSPVALCTSTTNAVNTYMRMFPVAQNFAGSQSGTPNYGDQGTFIEQGATATCRRGNGDLFPLNIGWRAGVNGENLGSGTPATIQGWVMRIYGSSDSPMTTRINTTVPLSSTRYINNGFAGFDATEANAAVPVPIDMTVRNFAVTTTGAQPGTGSLVFKVRQDGTTDICTVLTIPAGGGIGRWPWTPTTCNLTEGHWYAISVQNNATGASATITSIDWALIPQNTSLYSAIIPFVNGPGGSLADGDNYFGPFTNGVGLTATEITHRFPILTSLSSITMSHLYCKVSTSNPNALPVTIMRNGSPSSLTFTYTAGSTAVVGTNSVTQTFNDLDSYDLKVNKFNDVSPGNFNCMAVLSAEN